MGLFSSVKILHKTSRQESADRKKLINAKKEKKKKLKEKAKEKEKGY